MKDDNTREHYDSEMPEHLEAVVPDHHTNKSPASMILVPLDGSGLAEKALPHAVALARANSGGITLLRVVPPIASIAPLGGAITQSPALWDAWAAEPQIAHKYLYAVADKLPAAGLVVQTKVLQGDPAGEIVAYAERNSSVSLVVMSTHGRSGLGRWIMGSVAEKVLHASAVPIVVVRPQSDERRDGALVAPEYKTILAPLDGSVQAEQALGEVQMLAAKLDAKVILVSVTSTPLDLVLAGSRGGVQWQPIPRDAKAQRLWDNLYAVSRRLEAEHLVVETHLTYGDPADEILKVAKEVGADIIVMATHGRGGLPRFLVGSVAARVVQEASVPVLLVRVKANPVRTMQRGNKAQENQAPKLSTLL